MRCGDDVLKFMLEAVRTQIGPETFTEAHALEVELMTRREYGGAEVYISKVDRNARRMRVLADFDGTKASRLAICAREDLSKSQFYEIIKGG